MNSAVLWQKNHVEKRVSLVVIMLGALLAGCSDTSHAPVTTSDSPVAAETQVDQVHFPLEAYLSLDPSVSVPAVEYAIRTNRGDILEIVWIQGNCPEARKLALHYHLKYETAYPPGRIAIINTIADEREIRIAEIKEVTTQIPRHHGQFFTDDTAEVE